MPLKLDPELRRRLLHHLRTNPVVATAGQEVKL
jgi:hypothetical protein